MTMVDSIARDRLDVAGDWELAFDPDEIGASEGWMNGNWPQQRAIPVEAASIWNLIDPDYAGVGYYRRLAEIPAHWSGRTIRLHVGGAAYRAEAWLNGQYIGTHEGAYTEFWFDATAAVRFGETNSIVVRVTSLSRSHAVDGMVLKEMPVSKQSWYYAEGGLWGNVWFEALSHVRCESIAIEPDLRQETARIEVLAANDGSESRHVDLQVTLIDPKGEVAAEWREPVAILPGKQTYLRDVRLDRPMHWSLETPNLYRVHASLVEDGGEIDSLTTAFGMRDFTVREGRYFLNGEQIYIRGILLQPNFPIGLIAPADPGLIEREVLLAKEAGFNLIRIHIRPSIAGYYDLTDRHGMLVYAESSLAWLQDTPRLLDHGRREVTAMIERDRNHPSVAFWGIFNEHRAPASRYADALVRTARAIDPTRVIVDNSGGTLAMDQDFGWSDRATVVPNRETTRVPLHDVHIYIGGPVSRASCRWLREIGNPRPSVNITKQGFGSPEIFEDWYHQMRTDPSQILVSELGTGGMSDLDEMVAGYGERLDLLDAREFVAFRNSLHEGFAERGLGQVFGSVSNLMRAAQEQQTLGNRRQIEAVMANPRTSGYILTQLNDVGSEFHAGIVDIWRRPKPVFAELKRLNQDRCLILFGNDAVVACNDTSSISLTVIDRRHFDPCDRVAVDVIDPNGAVLSHEERVIPAGLGIKELGTITVKTNQVAGTYRVNARIVGATGDLMTTSESILALPLVDSAEEPDGVVWLGKEATFEATGHDPKVIVAADPNSVSTETWNMLFAAVESGSTAIIGPLTPSDDPAKWTFIGPLELPHNSAKRALAERKLSVELHMAIGSWMGRYHWQPDNDLFAGLPAGGLAGEAYVDVLPRYVLTETRWRGAGGRVSQHRNSGRRRSQDDLVQRDRNCRTWSRATDFLPIPHL